MMKLRQELFVLLDFLQCFLSGHQKKISHFYVELGK